MPLCVDGVFMITSLRLARARRQFRDCICAAQVWPEPPPKKFGEVISDFDPTAAGYEAQALAVERAAQAAMSGGAVHIGGAGSVDMSGVGSNDEVERRRLPWASGSLDGPDSLLPTLRAARLA